MAEASASPKPTPADPKAQLEALGERIVARLGAETGGAVQLHALRPLFGGACQENFFAELELESGELTGRHPMVLRGDAPSSLPGSIDRDQEYGVIRRAVAAGVKTPQAFWKSEGLLRDAGFSYFMPFVSGDAIARKVLKKPELAEARAALPRQLVEQLVAIHRIRPEGDDDALLRSGINPDPAADPAQSAIDWCRAMLDRLPEPRPVMELCLRWLADHKPEPRPLCLVHGDFRTGNFLVQAEGLGALLDWEFAHWGVPAEDLAWLCLRDWRFGHLDRAAGGLFKRAELYALYEELSGTAVDPREVHYWEVMGNLRWGAGAVYQGQRYMSGEQRDIELIAIARRAIEMEHEMLRLIQSSPR